MKFCQSMRFFAFIIPLFLHASFAQANKISDVELKNEFGNFILNNKLSHGLTGIPYVIQCPAYHNNQPLTINAGQQSTNGTLVDDRSLFQIGSNTKSFTSVVILQLETEGKLSLSNTVNDYFPCLYPQWRDITIKQLLNMTSGIRDLVNDETTILSAINENPYRIFTADDLLNSVKDLPLWFKPGTQWKYSNTNYVLAGQIIQQITGNPVCVEIKNRIILPLKLQHTYYINTYPKEDVRALEISHLMSGYFYETGGFPVQFPSQTDIINYSMSFTDAAGAITSTASDLNSYVKALFSGKLLPNKQLHELTDMVDTTNGQPLVNGVDASHPQGYGLGIGAEYNSTYKIVGFGHSGGTLGFNSTWQYWPAKQASYVIALNTIDKLNGQITLSTTVDNFMAQNCLANTN